MESFGERVLEFHILIHVEKDSTKGRFTTESKRTENSFIFNHTGWLRGIYARTRNTRFLRGKIILLTDLDMVHLQPTNILHVKRLSESKPILMSLKPQMYPCNFTTFINLLLK